MVEARGILAGMAADMTRLDARLILGLALGRDGGVLPHEHICLDDAAAARLRALTARRLAGEPVSRIKGCREFYSLDFEITPATLDPRPDSETGIAAAIEWLAACGRKTPRVLDLGTGSGCLLLAILHNVPHATGIGTDISTDAVAVARRNAAALGLDDRAGFTAANWDGGLDDDMVFDCIIANPPYIPSGDISRLAAEVHYHDPVGALDGGRDGLKAMAEIMPRIKARLAPHGRAFIEMGAGQAATAGRMARSVRLATIGLLPDLGGIDRYMVCKKT